MAEPMLATLVGGRYRLGALIGAGGMGRVYRADDLLTGQVVALKQVTLDTAPPDAGAAAPPDSEQLLNLAHEFRLLAALRHPHIISVYDFGFDAEQRPYVVMELLETPQTILEAGASRPLAEQVRLLAQALQALHYLHRCGILHHDLKPGNMLVSQGQLYLLDFGLSVEHGKQGADDTSGTLLYLAPEVLEGEPYTPAADLYAIGVVAVELLGGAHPFAAAGVSDFIDRVLDGAADLGALSAESQLGTVLTRMLSRQPAARYGDANAALHDLCAAAGVPVPAESQAIRDSFLQAAAFVGRAPELAQLEQALAELDRPAEGRAARAMVWLVGGESGVGKSRLLDEARIRALIGGATVLRGQAKEGRGLPYELWREPLRRLALSSALSAYELGVLGELLPDLGDLLDRPIAPVPKLDGVNAQLRLAQVVIGLLRRQPQRLVLILEDLQWTEESFVLLQAVARSLAGRPVLIIGSYRNDERPDLPTLLPEARVLTLRRLDAQEIGALSEAMLGAAGAAPDVLATLERESEGNAFFLVEVARALAEEAGGLGAIGVHTLPARIFAGGREQVIRRRLSHVPPAAREALKLAAIAGRAINPAILAPLLPPGLPLERWLRACAAAAVLEPTDTGWRFAHDKLRERVLADLDPAERPGLHRRVAEAIEGAYPEPRERETYAEVLLRHWHEAGDLGKECDYLRLASELALRQGLFLRARELAELGLAKLGGLSPDEERGGRRLRMLVALSETSMALGEYQRSWAPIEEALELAAHLGDEEGAAHANLSLAGLAWYVGNYPRAAAATDAARRFAERVGNRDMLATCLNLLGLLTHEQGEYAVAAEYQREGLAHARAIGSPNISGHLNDLGIALLEHGDLAAAEAAFEEALPIARADNNYRMQILLLNNLGDSAALRGDQAAAFYTQALALSQAAGDQYGEAINLRGLGTLAAAAGDLATAEDHFRRGVAIGRATGHREMLVLHLALLAPLRELATERAEVARLLQEALSAAQAMQVDPPLLALAWAAARIAHSRGDPLRAARLTGMVIANRHAPQHLRTTAELFRTGLRASLGEAELAAALAEGGRLAVEPAVREAIGALT